MDAVSLGAGVIIGESKVLITPHLIFLSHLIPLALLTCRKWLRNGKRIKGIVLWRLAFLDLLGPGEEPGPRAVGLLLGTHP